MIFPESPAQLTPDDPGPTIGDEFVGLNNAAMQDLVGASFGGAMVPGDAVELERFQGLVGSPAMDLPLLDPNPLPAGNRELEIDINMEGSAGRSRWLLKDDVLVHRAGTVERYSIDAIDEITLIGSSLNHRLVFRDHSALDSELESISIFGGGGRDRITLFDQQNASTAESMVR